MPLTPTQTRAVLAQLGIVPRKNLGQNFLTEGNLVRKSLALAELKRGDVVVEIGAGLGTLTEALLEAGAEVFAVEVDRHLDQNLRASLLPKFPDKFHLLEGDAVEHPRAGLPNHHPAAKGGTYKIVANLPYAVSTPWLDALLAGPLPERMVLMLQREAAARFTAAPGTRRPRGDFHFHRSRLRARGQPSRFTPMFLSRAQSGLGAAVPPPPARRPRFLSIYEKTHPRIFHATPQATRRAGAAREPAFVASWLERLPAHGLDARARPEELPLAAWLELDAMINSRT